MRKGIEVAAFCVVAILLFIWVNGVFQHPDRSAEDWVTDFYTEKSDSLDVIFIGASSMFTFWQPTLAWEAFGIASWNLTASRLPCTAPINMVKEALKTQSPSLFVVEAGTFLNVPTPDSIHRVSDRLQWSDSKISFIDANCRYMGVQGFDRLEYFLPVIRFHDRWNELKKDDVMRSRGEYKGSDHQPDFLNIAGSFDYDYDESSKVDPPGDFSRACLYEFLEYCKDNGLPVIFLASPNAKEDKGELRYIRSVVESYGFPFVMAIEQAQEIGLTFPEDYYNKHHTNLHGSIKCIAWFGRYLDERYGLPDRRGEKGYESWDKANDDYLKLIAPYLRENELEVLEKT